MSSYVQKVLTDVKAKNANEPEFIQAVEEVLSTLAPVLEANPQYEKAAILERMVEPERVVMFRVPWIDDNGVVQVICFKLLAAVLRDEYSRLHW